MTATQRSDNRIFLSISMGLGLRLGLHKAIAAMEGYLGIRTLFIHSLRYALAAA